MTRPICIAGITCIAIAWLGLTRAGEARYFGLVPPDTPQPFAPTRWQAEGRRLTQVAIAPGFRHAAVSVMDDDGTGKVAGAIYESRLEHGEWSLPQRAGGPDLSAGEGAFSTDGRWLFFSSDRPPGGPGRPRAFKLPVRGSALGKPEYVALEVADSAGVYYPRLLKSGDLAFTSRGPRGDDDLYIAPAQGSGFGKPEPLDEGFNSPKDDWDLIESRDGRLRIWVSAREGSLGRTDLYSSRRVRGTWSPPRNLTAVNTSALETAPALSPDGKVLFFLRRIDGRDLLMWVRADVVPGSP